MYTQLFTSADITSTRKSERSSHFNVICWEKFLFTEILRNFKHPPIDVQRDLDLRQMPLRLVYRTLLMVLANIRQKIFAGRRYKRYSEKNVQWNWKNYRWRPCVFNCLVDPQLPSTSFTKWCAATIADGIERLDCKTWFKLSCTLQQLTWTETR